MDSTASKEDSAEPRQISAPFFPRFFETVGEPEKELWQRGLCIDLGSSSLRVATWEGPDVNPWAQLQMPAYVSITAAGKVLLGQDAKSSFHQRPGNGFQVGTLIHMLHDARDSDNEGLRPPTYIEVENIQGEPREFLVIELIALLIRRARDLVEERCELEPYTSLVLNVPARCGFVQRQALKDAAFLAGFRRVRLLRAPAGVVLWRYFLPQALACAGNWPCPSTGKENVLAIDFGAMHIDCAVVRREAGEFETVFADGVADCGGNAVDHALAYICLGKALGWPSVGRFEDSIWRCKLTETHFEKLSAHCEKAKRALSADAKSIKIELKDCYADRKGSLSVQLGAEDLERALNSTGLLNRFKYTLGEIMRRVGKRLERLGPDKRCVDAVVLSGDAGKVPPLKRAVMQVFEKFFTAMPPVHIMWQNQSGLGMISASHAHACGGAVQGGILGFRKKDEIEGARQIEQVLHRMLLFDCMPSALGVDTSADRKDPRTNWLVTATNVPLKLETSAFAKMYNPAGAIVNFREDVSLDCHTTGWLGAVVVQAPPHVSAAARASDSSTNVLAIPGLNTARTSDVEAKLVIEIDQDTHFLAKAILRTAREREPGPKAGAKSKPKLGSKSENPDHEFVPLHHFVPRADCLDSAELEVLTSAFEKLYSTNGCLHYGLRSSEVLPNRLMKYIERASLFGGADSLFGGAVLQEFADGPILESLRAGTMRRDSLPPWHMDMSLDTLDCDPWNYGNHSSDSSEPEPEVEEKAPVRRNFGRERGGQEAIKDRLRQKIAEKRMEFQNGQVLTNVDDFSEPPLSTAVCAICLCSEVEIGRPFPFVLAKCGHKCLCKPCLRKMRASMPTGKTKKKGKVPEIECPLCRVRSKPVLCDQYNGAIYSAKDG